MGSCQSATTVSVLADGEPDSPFSIRRCPGYASGVARNPPEFQTMQDCALYSFKSFGDRPFLGCRKRMNGELASEYTFVSYRECEEIAYNLGSGIIHRLGLQPQELIGVFSENRPEWVHVINESCLYGHALVGLYGEQTLDFVIGNSRISTVFVSSKNAPKLVHILTENRHNVKSVVMFTESDRSNDYISHGLAEIGVEFVTFEELCDLGREHRKEIPKVEPDWIHYVCYSSGATGVPKGVLVSHRSQTSNTLAVCKELELNADSRHLSYLPLAHVFERIAVSITSFVGAKIGFFSGSIQRLLEDAQALRPTHLSAVPRVMRRIYDNVLDQVHKSWFLKRKFFWWAFKWKRFWLKRGCNTPVADKLVFRQIIDQFGGSMKQFLVGGAALEPVVHDFVQFSTGVSVRTGYGLTETGSGNVINSMDVRFSKPGTVGGPLSNVEIRLEPIPDYDDPECGEVLLGGECVCSGYLYDDEATEQLFVNEERTWVRTRDIAKWDSDNYLVIVDRVVGVFKLSQGEYVAAEILAAAYKQAPIVQQIFVYGDSTRSYLVAIVVPDKQEVASFVGRQNWQEERFAEFCTDNAVIEEVKGQLNQIATERNFSGYERIKAVTCIPDGWTAEMVTSAGKLKRRRLAERYKEHIERMYSSPDSKV